MILLYHKVDIVAPTTWWVSAAVFEKHMDALRGRRVVYLSDYDPQAPDQCVITFDDAYENVYRHALPILSERRLPFEVFINGDLLGRWNRADAVEPLTRYCTLAQLHEMAARGGRIQWHTQSHANLTTLDPGDVDDEIRIPHDLRQEFGEPHMTWFAYPFGAHSAFVVDRVRRRFRGAVSVCDGSDTDRFQLNRVVATERTRLEDLLG